MTLGTVAILLVSVSISVRGLIITARNEVGARLCLCVCDSVHRGGVLSRGGWSGPGGMPGGEPPGTATAAGGTHPTGMHSCFLL